MIIDARPPDDVLAEQSAAIFAAVYGMFRGALPLDMARQVSRQVRRAQQRRGDLAPVTAEQVLRRIEFGAWMPLMTPVEAALASGAKLSGTHALWRLGIAENEPEGLRAHRFAAQWARERAAEMIGMRRGPDGKLIASPNASAAITETTRDMVRGLVETAIERDWPVERLADELKQTHAFSSGRAETIARTEIASASNKGRLIAATTSGLVLGKRWVTKRDNRVEIHCADNERAGTIALEAPFPSGHQHPVAHPNCRCRLAFVS